MKRKLFDPFAPAAPAPTTAGIDVGKLTQSQAIAELKWYISIRCYNDRYFALDKRVQDAAVAEWVYEDVFGQDK
jgi:hypothetical protein